MIVLISVYNTQEPERSMYERFLYTLLQEREPYQNISHKEIPSYEDHVKFVRLQPYKGWYVLQDLESKSFLGAIYLTLENEIGIFISKNHLHQGWGSKALEVLYEVYPNVKTLKANVAPYNSKSICFFAAKGFNYSSHLVKDDTIIQYTYTKINPFFVEHASEEVTA